MNALPPSSGQMNLFGVVCGMTGRRECVHYVAVLGTIGPGQLSRCSDSLRSEGFEDQIPAAARFSEPVQTGPVVHPASYTIGIRSFQSVKRPERGVDHLLL